MLHLTNLDNQQLWKIIEQIKSKTEFGNDCHDSPHIEDEDMLSLVVRLTQNNNNGSV